MRVLRLCSVFEPCSPNAAIAFDPVGGMQSHTAELTRQLDHLGVHQVVVTTRPPAEPPEHRIGRHGQVIRMGASFSAFRQMWSVPAWRTVRELAAGAGKVDIVHAHVGEDLAIVPLALAAAARHEAKLVISIHTSLSYTFRVSHGLRATAVRSAILKTLGGSLERYGERRADAVVALTPRLARIVQAAGVPAERIYVIPSGVSSALFGPLQGKFDTHTHTHTHTHTRCKTSSDDLFRDVTGRRVGFVGRLAPQKGVGWLVEAAALLSSPDTSIVLIGDGVARRSLERRVHTLGLADKVHFRGFVGHELMPDVLAHLDVLVLPSVYEELGSTLVEGMWTGLPIVATRVGGIPDVIQHLRTGLLVRPQDPHGLATAIDRLVADPDLAAALGRNAREVAARYDWNVLARSVLGVYSAVLARD